jgi:hypothetical protein
MVRAIGLYALSIVVIIVLVLSVVLTSLESRLLRQQKGVRRWIWHIMMISLGTGSITTGA